MLFKFTLPNKFFSSQKQEVDNGKGHRGLCDIPDSDRSKETYFQSIGGKYFAFPPTPDVFHVEGI